MFNVFMQLDKTSRFHTVLIFCSFRRFLIVKLHFYNAGCGYIEKVYVYYLVDFNIQRSNTKSLAHFLQQ